MKKEKEKGKNTFFKDFRFLTGILLNLKLWIGIHLSRVNVYFIL